MNPIKYRDEDLVLKEGIKLSSRIWIPNSQGPWPALLMRQPYGKEIASTVTYAHPTWWALHDYLVVIQDVRGQGSSEGHFIGFNQEASDTSETLNWVRSLPECNGLIGTFGFSYQGLTQLLGTTISAPPDCMAPCMTGIDECSHWSAEGGAYWWHIGIAWGLQLAAQKLQRLKNYDGWKEIRESLESKSYLNNGVDLLRKHDPEGMAYNWLRESENLTNKSKIHSPLPSWLKQPMLLIGGWWDPHLKGILNIYEESIKQGGHPEIHIGPATHLEWWKGTNEVQLRFFNHHLKAKRGDYPLHTRRLWNLTTKKWSQSTRSKSITKAEWSLKSKGLACANEKDGLLVCSGLGEGNTIIVHDPWRPVPAKGGHLSPSPGEIDRSAIDERGDVATFTSKPFKEALLIEGTPEILIKASADTKGFDLFISLSIIFKNDSKVHQLSTGVLRIRGDEAQNNLERRISLQPFQALFTESSRMRLSISGSAWPAIAINPGTNEHPCSSSSAFCSITTISMDLTQSKLIINPIFHK